MSAQTLAAGEKGRSHLIRRAELKRELKSGTVKLSRIFRDDLPEWLETMPAERLLLCAPRVGTRAVHSLLLEARLGPMQEAQYITTRQRNLLADELEKIENLKHGRRHG
jgi:hypothetical protein